MTTRRSPSRSPHKRKSKGRTAPGRSAHVKRKATPKRYKVEPLVVLDVIESMSNVDAKVAKEIIERRREEKRRKEEGE